MEHKQEVTNIKDYVAAIQLCDEFLKDPTAHYTHDLFFEIEKFISDLASDFSEIFNPDICEQLASVIYGFLTGENTYEQIVMDMQYRALTRAIEFWHEVNEPLHFDNPYLTFDGCPADWEQSDYFDDIPF